MKNGYSTGEIAKILNIHVNTVRLYEDLGFISKPKRKNNGYRIFDDLNLEQLKIARYGLSTVVIQNNIRKDAIEIIKLSGNEKFSEAIELTQIYINKIDYEIKNAYEAITIVENILYGKDLVEENISLNRKDMANYLNVTVDQLRNWELNGLIKIKRKENGYRIYHKEDINHLRIIKALRCANYSLNQILDMINELYKDPYIDIRRELLDFNKDNNIIKACDHLVLVLNKTKDNGIKIYKILEELITKDK